ncbi:hypothetical protein SUGI_0756080 [Cryptomeria japonica]|nr:hypothetical protein SUGI_0756080 [Cryptomeria japonica]
MERAIRPASKGFKVALVLLLYVGVHGEGKGGFVLGKSAAGLDRGPTLLSDAGDVKISEGFIAKDFTGWERRDLRSSSCEETYGFMPCTRSVVGNLFLVVVYGYLLCLAAKFMADGSEELLAVTGPGIIGGLFLPVLGAFPDALLVLGQESSPPSFLLPLFSKQCFYLKRLSLVSS